MCKRKPKPTIKVDLTHDELWLIYSSVEHNIKRCWDSNTDKRLRKLMAKANDKREELWETITDINAYQK
jgi:hypothetical protein|tara:strand:- start:51 stop:257 length:207 start_codon:yes stop_codon:yes gene_type:complete